jgi:chromosome segregation ATPase
MSNEQDPMPKMQASQDDIALRQKQLQQRRIAAQRAAKAAPSSASQVIAPAPKQTIAILALIVALGLAGFAGFLFMQLQEATAQLKKAEGILNGHATNLTALNDKLSASDENSNLSVDALRILLKDNGKEIRKLWDLSNKTNKPKIAQNAKSIGSLKSSVANVDKSVTKVDKKIDQKVGSANTNISGNKKSIASLKTSLANSQKSLEAKMAEVKASVGALPAATEKRIDNNEQSIRSIDATRMKLNSSMAEVESQFNEMKLEIEDIQIRLDRMQNAMTGTL